MEIAAPKSRNDPCPCGSGKRYKHCHGATEQPGTAAPPVTTAIDIALQGLAAQQAGDVSAAIALYGTALALDPVNADALHMLGVAHMQRFEPEAALAFIQRAAVLTDWQIPAMRHNYGWALSVLMSARPPANLSARAAMVSQSRAARVALSNRSKANVAVLALCRTHHEAVAIVAQMQRQSHPPVAVVVLLPASECAKLSAFPASTAAEPQTVVFPSALPHSAEGMIDALRTLDCQYVQLVVDPVAYSPTRLEQMGDALASSGAGWGFSKAMLDDGQAESMRDAEPPMLAALKGLERLKHRPRMGDLLV